MKKTAVLVSVAFSLLLVVPTAEAGFIVEDGQVTMVSNTSSNMARYHVRIGGGTGVCADSFLIFDESNAGNPDVFKRGFAVALTALATGMPVDVWAYGPDDCRSPAGIWIGE